jgi:hypothetical protein
MLAIFCGTGDTPYYPDSLGKFPRFMGLERDSLAKFLFLLKFAIDSSRQRSYGLGREGETGEPDAEAVRAGVCCVDSESDATPLCAGTAKLPAKLWQENSEWNEGLRVKFEKRGLTSIFGAAVMLVRMT